MAAEANRLGLQSQAEEVHVGYVAESADVALLAANGRLAQLQQLAALYASGGLSEAEFDAARGELLS